MRERDITVPGYGYGVRKAAARTPAIGQTGEYAVLHEAEEELQRLPLKDKNKDHH